MCVWVGVTNWLMQSWRLRSPTICCLQAADPGKHDGDAIQSESKGLGTREN